MTERLMDQDIYVEHVPTGGWSVACVYRNQWYHQRFLDCTRREAVRKFREDVFAEDAKVFRNM